MFCHPTNNLTQIIPYLIVIWYPILVSQTNKGKYYEETGAYPFLLTTHSNQPILIERATNKTIKSIGGRSVGEWALSFVRMDGINYGYKGGF